MNKKRKVIILANNKVEAKDQVLTNHPKYEVISVLSQEELKAVKSLTKLATRSKLPLKSPGHARAE